MAGERDGTEKKVETAAAAADNPIASLRILPALARATLAHSVVASLCIL